jgi:hypothetical protein
MGLDQCEPLRGRAYDLTEAAKKDPVLRTELLRAAQIAHREQMPDGFGVVEDSDPDADIFDALQALPVADLAKLAKEREKLLGGIVVDFAGSHLPTTDEGTPVPDL